MKRIDISHKSKDELAVMLKEQRSKLVRLKFDQGEKKLKDSSQLGKIKRDIARILTSINLQND